MGVGGGRFPLGQEAFTVMVTSPLGASVSSSAQRDDTTYQVSGRLEEHTLHFLISSHSRACKRFVPLSPTSSVKSLNGFTFFLKKETMSGTSLVAQWLRICLPMQWTQVRALVREDPTCPGATKPLHNY